VAKAALGGWGINAIYSYGSGYPFTPNLSFNNSRTGTPLTNDRPSLAPGANNNPIEGVTAGCELNPTTHLLTIPAGQKLRTADRWFDPCSFVLSAPGTFGNLGRNTITAPGVNKVDFTILKTTSIGEGKKLEFRAEFFNLFN